MTPLLLVVSFTTSGLLGMLLWVAIAAVVVWAIIALVRWSGIPIPEPVRIILIALVCIFLIIFLFKIFGVIA
jgi:hypothetical protein